jgi:hypothetical protein
VQNRDREKTQTTITRKKMKGIYVLFRNRNGEGSTLVEKKLTSPYSHFLLREQEMFLSSISPTSLYFTS